MSNVQFEDPNAGLTQFGQPERAYSGFIGLLINKGVAKDKRTANIILISLIALCVFVSAMAIKSRFSTGSDFKNKSPEEIQQMRHLPKIR
ncbi:hypothetical protein BH11PAT3_BH11PAT3_0860 [soil metagenome]